MTSNATRVLVTGGAGYIGSHACRRLCSLGYPVTVVDDLSHGHAAAVDSRAVFHQVSVGDHEAMTRILRDDRIDLVMHFAAFIEVGESVVDPAR